MLWDSNNRKKTFWMSIKIILNNISCSLSCSHGCSNSSLAKRKVTRIQWHWIWTQKREMCNILTFVLMKTILTAIFVNRRVNREGVGKTPRKTIRQEVIWISLDHKVCPSRDLDSIKVGFYKLQRIFHCWFWYISKMISISKHYI